jgi:hypothetical protein
VTVAVACHTPPVSSVHEHIAFAKDVRLGKLAQGNRRIHMNVLHGAVLKNVVAPILPCQINPPNHVGVSECVLPLFVWFIRA